MNFTVLVPARMASTRLPGKPLADIGGLPMVVRVAQRAAQSAAQRVVVAADHPDIIAACARHGVAAVLTRTDHPTGSDRLAEACALLGLDGTDMVVNAQGDEPLLDPGLIDACAELLARSADCVMSTAATPWRAQAATMSGWSAATTTRCAADAAARCATRTTIGSPPMSASGLPGRRVDAIRAGTSTVKFMHCSFSQTARSLLRRISIALASCIRGTTHRGVGRRRLSDMSSRMKTGGFLRTRSHSIPLWNSRSLFRVCGLITRYSCNSM